MIKKVIKKLAKSKNITTFAVLNIHKSGENYRPSYREAFFYALSVRNNIGSVPPCNFRNGIATALVVCLATAKAEPLFCFSPYHSERNNKQNFFKMLNKKKPLFVWYGVPHKHARQRRNFALFHKGDRLYFPTCFIVYVTHLHGGACGFVSLSKQQFMRNIFYFRKVHILNHNAEYTHTEKRFFILNYRVLTLKSQAK